MEVLLGVNNDSVEESAAWNTYDLTEEQPMRFHHQALDPSCDGPNYPGRDLQQSCWGATVNCKLLAPIAQYVVFFLTS